MKRSLTFSEAVEGYLLAATARHLSKHTISDYINTYRKFQFFLDDDPPIDAITTKNIQEFLAVQTVTKKTILNYLTGLSALWSWAIEDKIVPRHIVQEIERPKPEKRPILPYTEEDIRSMLDSLSQFEIMQA